MIRHDIVDERFPAPSALGGIGFQRTTSGEVVAHFYDHQGIPIKRPFTDAERVEVRAILDVCNEILGEGR